MLAHVHNFCCLWIDVDNLWIEWGVYTQVVKNYKVDRERFSSVFHSIHDTITTTTMLYTLIGVIR